MSNDAVAKNKAKPGWYNHPSKEGFERLWDGESWTEEVRLKDSKPDGITAGGMIALGLVLALATGALSGALLDGDADLQAMGIIVLVIGGLVSQVVLLIGIIAKGVEIGNRASR